MGSQGKTVGQMKAEDQEWADQQEIVTSCALDGCDWTFNGAAILGREAAVEHRRTAHPTLRPRTLGQIQSDVKRKKEAKKLEQKEEFVSAWNPKAILEAIKAFAQRHDGRAPTTSEAGGKNDLPSQTTVAKHFGSWAAAIEQAGFPRPMRGRKADGAESRPRVTRGEKEDKIDFEGRVRTLVKGVLDEVEAEAILASRDIRTRAAEIIRDALHSLTEEAA